MHFSQQNFTCRILDTLRNQGNNLPLWGMSRSHKKSRQLFDNFHILSFWEGCERRGLDVSEGSGGERELGDRLGIGRFRDDDDVVPTQSEIDLLHFAAQVRE